MQYNVLMLIESLTRFNYGHIHPESKNKKNHGPLTIEYWENYVTQVWPIWYVGTMSYEKVLKEVIIQSLIL